MQIGRLLPAAECSFNSSTGRCRWVGRAARMAHSGNKGAVDPSLVGELYYHGLLPREDLKEMVRNNGDFLVRTSEPSAGSARAYILSVMVHQEREELGIKHFVIHHHPSGWSIDKYSFESIKAMVQHHLTKQDSVSKRDDSVLLKNPIHRQSWELAHEDIACTKKLGEGAFGEVHKGTLKLKNGQLVDVAIKLAKLEQLTKEQIKEIMLEARLMRNFDHVNVVKFYGVAAGQEPLMVLMELCDCGALDSYLQKHEQPVDKKTELCMQACWGIEYLHSRTVIHRDIAARNCLYGHGQVKVSDFGLTREGTVFQMDPRSRVPIRWLAPETMRMFIYTQKTDVWAFGILCWEIYSNGLEPYPGMSPSEAFLKVKNENYRMTLPDGVPAEIASLITKKIWAENPNDRPGMPDLAHQLELITRLPRPPAANTATQALPVGPGTTTRASKKKKKK